MTRCISLVAFAMLGQIPAGPCTAPPLPPDDKPAQTALAGAELTADPPFGGLFGRVQGLTESGPVPLAGALVIVRRDDHVLREVRTNDDGWYEIGEIPSGEYVVLARARGFQAQDARVTVEAGSKARHDFLLTPAPPAGAVVGRVFGLTDDGRVPLAGALVVLRRDGHVLREAHTNDRGWYEFADVPPGEYGLLARAEGFRPEDARIEVLPGGETRQDFLLPAAPPPGAILGRVLGRTDDGETPLDDAVLLLIRGPDVLRVALTGDDGRFAMDPVPPGAFALLAQARGYFPRVHRVVVMPGTEVRQVFLLEPLGGDTPAP